jgi:hypothetical protein
MPHAKPPMELRLDKFMLHCNSFLHFSYDKRRLDFGAERPTLAPNCLVPV